MGRSAGGDRVEIGLHRLRRTLRRATNDCIPLPLVETVTQHALVLIAGFDDEKARDVTAGLLPVGHRPLGVLPIGHPANTA